MYRRAFGLRRIVRYRRLPEHGLDRRSEGRKAAIVAVSRALDARPSEFAHTMSNPESTEGGRRGSVLKWPEGAPVNLG